MSFADFWAALTAAITAVLDFLLGWTTHLPPILGIFCLALIITMLVNFIYKLKTDQSEMKRLKEQMDDYRKKMKHLAKENPKKALKMQEEMMQVNMKYMGKSFKPMLYTFIPIIIIFGWMTAHYTYAPLEAGQPLTVTTHFINGFSGDATLTSSTLAEQTVTAQLQTVDKETVAPFAVSGTPGQHDFVVHYQNFSYNGTVWFGENPKETVFSGSGPVNGIAVDYPRVHPLGGFHLGSWYPGWLALYIVFSIALSIGTRKLMKIY